MLFGKFLSCFFNVIVGRASCRELVFYLGGLLGLVD